MIFRTCPDCGCALDPGERCDCLETEKEAAPQNRERPQAKVSIASLPVCPPKVNVDRRYRNG